MKFKGKQATLRYTCTECNGTGEVDGAPTRPEHWNGVTLPVTCGVCAGTGEVIVPMAKGVRL